MKQKLLLTMVLLISINLFALECNESSFNKGNEEMRQLYSLYNKTTVATKEQKAIISKSNYSEQMKILEDRLVVLEQSKSYLFQANMLNTINIDTWKDLEKTCKDKYLYVVQKARMNAENMQKTIKERLDIINSYINQTEIVITVGKKKYSGAKENN